MSPRDAIKRLNRFRAKLEDPRAFYELAIAEWKELARQTALTIVLASRPPEQEPGRWNELARNLANSVGAQLLTGEMVGILLFAGRNQADFEGSLTSLLFEDVVAYVRDGRDGKPFGKADFTAEDEAKDDEQVALNIWESLQEGNPDRRAAIEAHLTNSLGGEARALYPEILATWTEVFSLRVRADFRRWAIRQF